MSLNLPGDLRWVPSGRHNTMPEKRELFFGTGKREARTHSQRDARERDVTGLLAHRADVIGACGALHVLSGFAAPRAEL